MLFSKTQRRQPVLHKIIELVNIESRFALKSRQLADSISNLRSVGTESQPFRFMPQNQQVNDELHSSLILVHPGACGHCSHKIRHTKCLRQVEEPHHLLRFQYRNISIVDPSKLVPAYRAVIRALHKIENER